MSNNISFIKKIKILKPELESVYKNIETKEDTKEESPSEIKKYSFNKIFYRSRSRC